MIPINQGYVHEGLPSGHVSRKTNLDAQSILSPFELLHSINLHKLVTYLREAMEKQHERFGAVSGSDKVELDPIGCHVLVGAQGWIQQAGGRD